MNNAFGIEFRKLKWPFEKNVKKYKIERSSLSIKKIAQVAGEQNVHRKTLIFFKKSLSKIQEYQPERMVQTLIRVHLTESLGTI